MAANAPKIIEAMLQKSDGTEFCSVNMDARYYRISVACDTME